MMLMPDPQPNDPFEWTQERWGRALRCPRLGAPHLFSSGDVTLRDDEGEWEAIAASMAVPRERLLLVKQVHGVHVQIVRQGEPIPALRQTADIIVTDDPSVAIGVRTADCAAVLLHDPVTHAVGAAHAGWRGTAAAAAAAAVRAMRETFGSRPADLVAAIGPCLGACCGEVGPEVIDAFRAGGAGDAEIAAWFAPGRGDRSMLDLERANRDQLVRAGLAADAIFTSGLCTKTHHDRLHSYRVPARAPAAWSRPSGPRPRIRHG
jgi:purine-nucleoside/S-methyl-5'-thioadenosine phosphorylase / adenosine deaminase